jgi:CcmD family protein
MTEQTFVRRVVRASAGARRMQRGAGWWVMMALVGACAALPARASAQASDAVVDAADERATAFRAVQGPSQESVPGGALFVAGYAMVWLLVFGYVIRLHRMSIRASREIHELRALAQQVNTQDARPPSGAPTVERG